LLLFRKPGGAVYGHKNAAPVFAGFYLILFFFRISVASIFNPSNINVLW
jgi:hypothetical protein